MHWVPLASPSAQAKRKRRVRRRRAPGSSSQGTLISRLRKFMKETFLRRLLEKPFSRVGYREMRKPGPGDGTQGLLYLLCQRVSRSTSLAPSISVLGSLRVGERSGDAPDLSPCALRVTQRWEAPRDSARVSPYLSCLLACLRRRRKKAQEGARRRKKAHDTRDSVTREIRCTACAPSSPKATQGEREENACACQLRLRRMRFGDKRDLVQGEREEFSRERLCTFFAEGDARRKSSPLAKEKRCAEFLERPPLRLRRWDAKRNSAIFY